MTLWYPPDFEHNKILNLFGDSPYYHVAENIYQALRAYGGYTPSFSNPIATEDYVDALLAASTYKRAWGYTGIYDIIGTRPINTLVGTSWNGSYYGDTGFSKPPSVIVGERAGLTWTSSTNHGHIVYPINVTANGFDIWNSSWHGCTQDNWMCVGV
jgi:hypothetical protein